MTKTQRSKIIETAIEIGKIEARLSVLYRHLDELTGSSKERPSTQSGNVRNGSYRAAIHATLNKDPEQAYSEDQLMSAAAVSDGKKNSFRSTLSRLVKSKEINRVGPKTYSLKQAAEQGRIAESD